MSSERERDGERERERALGRQGGEEQEQDDALDMARMEKREQSRQRNRIAELEDKLNSMSERLKAATTELNKRKLSDGKATRGGKNNDAKWVESCAKTVKVSQAVGGGHATNERTN